MASARMAPKRPRRNPRSQEERSASTRSKIVAAATECVAELGLRAATMGAIADRAGVSWGAIQHQFGEKDSLFDAVLEAAIEDLRMHFDAVRESSSDPVQRVRGLITRCRVVLAGPLYKSFFEIQLSRGRESDEQTEAWSGYIGAELAGAWHELFGDLDLTDQELGDAQRFTFAALSGIASEAMLFPSMSQGSRQLEILEETLLRLLELEA